MENTENKKIDNLKEPKNNKEKIEKEFYGETVRYISRYFYDKIEDLIKYINNELYNFIKDDNENVEDKNEIFNIMSIFLENTLTNFKKNFDKGELAMKKCLDLDMNLIEKIENNNNNIDKENNDEFNDVKNNFIKNIQENLKLKIILNLQEKILKFRKENYGGNKELENKIELLKKGSDINSNSFEVLDENINIIYKNLQNLNNEI
jgi:hypothetical protein